MQNKEDKINVVSFGNDVYGIQLSQFIQTDSNYYIDATCEGIFYHHVETNKVEALPIDVDSSSGNEYFILWASSTIVTRHTLNEIVNKYKLHSQFGITYQYKDNSKVFTLHSGVDVVEMKDIGYNLPGYYIDSDGNVYREYLKVNRNDSPPTLHIVTDTIEPNIKGGLTFKLADMVYHIPHADILNEFNSRNCRKEIFGVQDDDDVYINLAELFEDDDIEYTMYSDTAGNIFVDDGDGLIELPVSEDGVYYIGNGIWVSKEILLEKLDEEFNGQCDNPVEVITICDRQVVMIKDLFCPNSDIFEVIPDNIYIDKCHRIWHLLDGNLHLDKSESLKLGNTSFNMTLVPVQDLVEIVNELRVFDDVEEYYIGYKQGDRYVVLDQIDLNIVPLPTKEKARLVLNSLQSLFPGNKFVILTQEDI